MFSLTSDPSQDRCNATEDEPMSKEDTATDLEKNLLAERRRLDAVYVEQATEQLQTIYAGSVLESYERASENIRKYDGAISQTKDFIRDSKNALDDMTSQQDSKLAAMQESKEAVTRLALNQKKRMSPNEARHAAEKRVRIVRELQPLLPLSCAINL